MATMVLKLCACCGKGHEVRRADLDRGWGKFCSKRCKAIAQEKKNGQHAAYLNGKGVSNLHPERMKKIRREGKVWMNSRTGEECDPFDDEGYLHDFNDDTHPFSSEGLGQWE